MNFPSHTHTHTRTHTHTHTNLATVQYDDLLVVCGHLISCIFTHRNVFLQVSSVSF
jgi:hypothetical protein